QPVHTMYWGAHVVAPDVVTRLGDAARASFERHAPDPVTLARALGFPGSETFAADAAAIAAIDERFAADADALHDDDPDAWLAWAVHARVRDKLAREPVEDLRIDFEDGYGIRDDAEEDGHAEACARIVAEGIRAGRGSAAVGIRVKPFTDACAQRSIATIDRFVCTLADALGGLPPGFRVMLPKVTMPEQVDAIGELLGRLEHRRGLAEGALPFEIMVEVTQALFDPHGRFQLPLFVRAGGPRLVAVALGVYDFTASCNVAAAWQAMDHPMCDLARGLMTLACAGTHVQLCDGSTNVLPVEPHPGDEALDEDHRERNRSAVHRAWRLSHDHIHRSLVGGWVQGWDLHPAQIPVRFATCYRFWLEGFAAAAQRLRSYLARATAATDGAAVLDDAATGQALLGFFLRAHECGAIGTRELERTGLRDGEWTTRSFAAILAGRRAELARGENERR
ncbi:MAG TPA: hypothetical protein VFG69_18035, partial [Nannocystaceae bacterium]|nr:hypothetical protein [Nannocystaceae bacterium]